MEMATTRRRFTREFKDEAVRLAKSGEESIAAIARNLDLSGSLLHRWIKQYDIDRGAGGAGSLTTQEREELRRLRRELRQVKMEREILKKATAFFAKEDE